MQQNFFSQVCEDLTRCGDIKNCQERHPKTCRRFANGNDCKFEEECAYHHKENANQGDKGSQIQNLYIGENWGWNGQQIGIFRDWAQRYKKGKPPQRKHY